MTMDNTSSDSFAFNSRVGWPPTILNEERVHCIHSYPADYTFTRKEQRENLNEAINNPEVRKLLNGRWETLGCHLVSQGDQYSGQEIKVRICLFNYTTNQLIEIYLENKVVVSVSIREPHEHPESRIEIVQAMGIIESNPELQSKIKGLEGNAILRVPSDPHGPSYNHRCMHVIYTLKDDRYKELPVLFSALVDLTLQKVIAYATTPCGEEKNDQNSKEGVM